MDGKALMLTSLFNLPDELVKNRVFDEQGRNTAAEACVVTVAIFFSNPRAVCVELKMRVGSF